MYDAINTLASKERERQRIAVLVDQHFSAGKPVATLAGFTPKPLPARSSKIDRETVLKLRRNPKRELSAFARRMLEAGI